MMIKRLFVASLALACAAAAMDADAQKLYRWVDQDGKVHYSDKVPPQEVDKARDEINAQGRTVKSVDRALTEDELEHAARDAADAEEARKVKEAQDRMDHVLMASYESEDDLKRAYDERFDLIRQSIESAQVGVRSQEKSLADILAHAASLERSGKPVGDSIKKSIEASRKQVLEQTAYLERREAEQHSLQAEYDSTLARYRELKAAQQARLNERR
ncbi:MAG: DUF4124 domain-containing protein [Lysobacteraceae bacterium]